MVSPHAPATPSPLPQQAFTLLGETAELLGRGLLGLMHHLHQGTTTWHSNQCHHHQAPMSEGLVQCPSCQQAVVRRWYVVRCSGCHHRRPATYASTWQRWLPWLWPTSHRADAQGLCPANASCAYCGQHAWHAEPLSHFEAQHSAFAILAAEPALSPKGVAWAKVRPIPTQRQNSPFEGYLPKAEATPSSGEAWPVWLSLPKQSLPPHKVQQATESTFALALWPKREL